MDRNLRLWGARFGALAGLVGVAAAVASFRNLTAVTTPTPPPPVVPAPTEVTCTFDGPVPPGAAVRMQAGPDLPGRVVAGALTFTTTERAGSGILRVTGFSDLPFDWAEGACTVPLRLVALASAPHRGRVAPMVEGSKVSVQLLCDNARGAADVGPDGSFEVLVATVSPCQLQLSRPFGELVLTGPWVGFEEGGVYPPPAPEGLGVAAVSDGAGLRVVAVEPGMPAARAGLRVGDLVTSVEGVGPDEFSPELFDDLPQGRTLRITRGDTEVVVRP